MDILFNNNTVDAKPGKCFTCISACIFFDLIYYDHIILVFIIILSSEIKNAIEFVQNWFLYII